MNKIELSKTKKKLSLIARCQDKGIKLTKQRRLIAQILDNTEEHQDANGVFIKASLVDKRISLSTVYRTLSFFVQKHLLDGQSFGMSRRFYETTNRPHHDHLIDIETGEIIEFQSHEIEKLQHEIARKLGYKLESHCLELFGRKKQ